MGNRNILTKINALLNKCVALPVVYNLVILITYQSLTKWKRNCKYLDHPLVNNN